MLLLAVVIQFGNEESSVRTTEVKDPVVAQELALQALMAGLEVYAPELTEGRASVTVVVEPTGALEVTPVPLSQACRLQLQAGVATVAVKATVIELTSDE